MAPMVLGGYVLSMLAAMGPFRPTGERILAEHGIAVIEPTDWYALSDYADALYAIERKMGANTVFRIGKQLPTHIQLPPDLETFEAIMGGFGPCFESHHRDAASGGITYEITGPGLGTIVSATPYPCEFDRGVIVGFFEKLLGARVSVKHDPSKGCKRTGGTTCTHLIARTPV